MNSISQHISRIRYNKANTNVIYYINDKMSEYSGSEVQNTIKALPFSKLVALLILTPIVMQIVTCRGSVQKKFELMEIALGDYCNTLIQISVFNNKFNWLYLIF